MAVDPNVVDMGLPPEYQALIDEAQRKRAMADLLAKQSMGFQGAESKGKIAAKTSPFAWLANAATGYFANKAASDAQQQARQTQGDFQNAQNAEMQRILGLPEKDQISVGLASKFPLVQQNAHNTRKEQEARRKAAIDAAGRGGDTQLALGLAAGGDIRDAKVTPPKDPKFGVDGNGNPYAIDYGLRGEQTVKFAPKGLNVNIPGNEAQASLKILEDDLKNRRTGADAAKGVLASNARVIDALEQGAKAGGGQDIYQVWRKVAQALDIPNASTAPTESLGMALGEQLLAKAGELKPVSNEDMRTLRNILGTVSTDPTALTRGTAFLNAMALKSLKGYGDWVSAQKDSLQTPFAKDMFANAGMGYELPSALSGPLAHQLETVRSYRNLGGDISMFRDPTGQPFALDSKIQVDPNSGFPGLPASQPAPASVKGKAPARSLTAAEETRLQKLKAWVSADPATRGPMP